MQKADFFLKKRRVIVVHGIDIILRALHAGSKYDIHVTTEPASPRGTHQMLHLVTVGRPTSGVLLTCFSSQQ